MIRTCVLCATMSAFAMSALAGGEASVTATSQSDATVEADVGSGAGSVSSPTNGAAEGNSDGSGEDAMDPTPAMAEDVDLDAAERIYRRSCRACHGNNAGGAGSYPGLADKEPEHIAEMLRRYRAGERIGPNSILMIENARDLTDEEIVSLAEYVTTAFD